MKQISWPQGLFYKRQWMGMFAIMLGSVLLLSFSCSKGGNKPNPPAETGASVSAWLTKSDGLVLLQKQTAPITFGTTANNYANIEIDTATSFQSVDGFGYTLTGASAWLINSMVAEERTKLLRELFSNDDNAIGVSYLRISLGASDLSNSVFSYNDLPAGQTDENLLKFSLANDTTDLIPVIKQILAINPNVKFMASPWSAPTWMKSNGSSVGGSLLPQYYGVYARYFVKYIQAMKAKGITVDAVTVQNEPQHGGNNPSMVMSAAEQADFVKNHLGPAFRDAGITTKIIIWDHNCDNPNYPITVLNDAGAKQFINGSAFHLYSGDISALNQVYTAHPDKALYFTEQWTGSKGSFDGDLKWHLRNVIIGSMRYRSRIALEWNLANDPSFGPHTPGGCTECKGAITLSGSSVTRNVSYYIVAHASKFVPQGSVVVSSNGPGNLSYVAFVTPAGKKVLIVLNDGSGTVQFNIKQGSKWAPTSLVAGAVATYTW